MSDNRQNNKLIAKNTVLLAIRQVLVMAMAFYTSRITLKVLGVDDFGIYNVVCGFVTMFTFLNGAFATGIQRFYNYEIGNNGKEGANRVFINAFLVQIILAVIIVVLVESVGLWYMYSKMVITAGRFAAAMWVFQISVVSTVVMMLQVPYNAAILAHEKMNFFAFLSILNQILKLIIVIVLQYMTGDKLILYGFLFLLVTFLDLLLNIIYARMNFEEINFKAKFDKFLLKDMLSFSGWNVFGKFSYVMREMGLNLVLNFFFGPALNASRGLAFQVTGALKGFVSNVNVAVKPQLTQSYAQGNIDRTMSLFYSVSKLGFFILFIMVLPVCLEIDFILDLWLGEGAAPQYTNIFIVLVSIMALIDTLNSQVSFVIHATGIMMTYQLVTGLVELLIVPLVYVTLRLGAEPTSVFVVSIVVIGINLVVSLFIMRSIVNISLRFYVKNVLKPLFLSIFLPIILSSFLFFVIQTGWARFIMVCFISILSSTVTFYIMGLNKNEKTLVNLYISKYLNRLKTNGK